jgi:cytochrome b subunit of formate dehydrogenase
MDMKTESVVAEAAELLMEKLDHVVKSMESAAAQSEAFSKSHGRSLAKKLVISQITQATSVAICVLVLWSMGFSMVDSIRFMVFPLILAMVAALVLGVIGHVFLAIMHAINFTFVSQYMGRGEKLYKAVSEYQAVRAKCESAALGAAAIRGASRPNAPQA